MLVCVLFSYLWEHFINKKMKKKILNLIRKRRRNLLNFHRTNQKHTNVVLMITLFLFAGSALMNIVGVYKEIQDQHMNIVCAFILFIFMFYSE